MKILIIGFGNMGSAIGRKLSGQKGFQVFGIDRDPKKIRSIKNIIPGRNFKHLPKCEFIIVAVKPQDVGVLASQLRDKISMRTILISIAAGVKIAKLAKLFKHKKSVRVMPNLGLTVGQGIAVWKSSGLSPGEKRKAKRLLNAITENFYVGSESLIDAATAVSGSGPAYFFLFADYLRQAAEALGLNSANSRLLVEKTLAASALLQQGRDYSELIKRVASKKGTTEAALKVFKGKHLGKIVSRAVKAAYERAKELNK